MTVNKKLGPVTAIYGHGAFCFTFLGYGFVFSLYSRNRPLFSERNGDRRPIIRFGNWARVLPISPLFNDVTTNAGSLTFDELVTACKNIGYDLTCGACASVFFCGFAMPGDEHTCNRVEYRANDSLYRPGFRKTHASTPRIR